MIRTINLVKFAVFELCEQADKLIAVTLTQTLSGVSDVRAVLELT